MVDQSQAYAGKPAFTVDEFCRAHGVGRSYVYEQIASGRLRTRKAGRRTLILAADAAQWLAALPEGRAA